MAVSAFELRWSSTLLNCTSSRYNERKRRAERHLVFDVPALLRIIAKAAKKPLESILNFSKLAEGGSYRVFEAIFADGITIIARLRYTCTLPRTFGIASEVATMHFLRQNGIPVPHVFDFQTTASNTVGSEYMIMAKVEGQELEHTWYTMNLQERIKVIEKIVGLERKLFQIQLPACGSLYYSSFLESQEGLDNVALGSASTNADEREFCIGPSAAYLWWYSCRDKLTVNRGPRKYS